MVLVRHMNILINDKLVPVIIIRKKIKNIYMRFDENLNLVVSTNKYTSEREILNILAKNQNSLERMYLRSSKHLEKSQEFWFLGKEYQVIYDENVKNVAYNDNEIICKNSKMLDLYIKNEAQRIFSTEVLNYKKIIKTPDFTLKIRKMKTRWGVCNYKAKTITLNLELIKYPIECLRYVIVHEMCHFYHHNHSKEFWTLVGEYYPNYKIVRKELRS